LAPIASLSFLLSWISYFLIFALFLLLAPSSLENVLNFEQR
jgi:hypothetical protein